MNDFWFVVDAIGLAVITYYLYETLLFLWLYIRPSSLSRYQHGTDSWALVTGASDGIGYALVEELSERGFNVLLHGRNAAKLEKIKAQLEARHRYTQYIIAVADASAMDSQQQAEKIVKVAKNVRLTVLINNVGGTQMLDRAFKTFENHTAADVDALANLNLRFATHLTRFCLPLLSRNTPALILNTCSLSGKFDVPFLVVYSATKAFMNSMSVSLGREMSMQGKDIEVLGLLVGKTQSLQFTGRPSLFMPTSRAMAKACLAKVGCGRGLATPYWSHALQGVVTPRLPFWMIAPVLKKELEESERAYKADLERQSKAK